MPVFMSLVWPCALLLWSLATLLALRWLSAGSPTPLWPGIVFAPTEPVAPPQLAAYLLSANLALLANDDFNQLESALSPRRVRQVLRRQWKIGSHKDFERTLGERLNWCGTGTPDEMKALAAWREGRRHPGTAGVALDGICKFLSVQAGIVAPRSIGACHMNLMAWDVQQLAYMVRLGAARGYLARPRAQSLLAMLHREARMHYTSWSDYSLSSLIGMGLRSPVDLHEANGWHLIAASHAALLSTPTSPMTQAGLWSTAAVPVAPIHSLPPLHVGPLSNYFEPLP